MKKLTTRMRVLAGLTLAAMLLTGCVTARPSTLVPTIPALPISATTTVVQGADSPTSPEPATVAPTAGTTFPTALPATVLPALPSTAFPTALPATVLPALPSTTPLAIPVPGDWTPARDPEERWIMTYPANLLNPIDMGSGMQLFLSGDRAHLVAVETFFLSGPGVEPALASRANSSLTRIYSGTPPATLAQRTQNDAPWQYGYEFTTRAGSVGQVSYSVHQSREQTLVYGFYLGRKADGPQVLHEALLQTVARLQLIPPVQPPDNGMEAARQALTGFFQALVEGRYGAAAANYGGSYDVLQELYPTVDGNDHAGLWAQACAMQSFHCLAVGSVLNQQQGESPGEYRFNVSFITREDGILMGADGRRSFDYRVVRLGDRYLVQELPVYLP